ncbi:MAG: hypothetical protein KIS61_23660 [Candidatus Eremiobacteraeota bacterium]|nr:hypothetical protein [Candidatus Eremiobacteraeota bacterium]
MEIGISELPQEAPKLSLFRIVFACLYLLDFLASWLIMPIVGLFLFLASVLPVS